MKKKILSLFLSAVMVFTMLPTYTAAFAADAETCDHIFSEETLPAEDSDFWETHSEDEYYVGSSAFISAELPASCTENGWRLEKTDSTGFCMICGQFITDDDKEPLPATDHNFSDVVSDATCTEDAVYECSNVNYTLNVVQDSVSGLYSASLVPVECTEQKTAEGTAFDHDYELVDHKDATCTEDGYDKYVCRNDESHTYSDEITKLGHNWSEWEVTEEATCEEAGSKKRTCSNCNEVETEEIPATGHDWSDWTVTQDSTCTVEGTKVRSCNTCNKEDFEKIDKLPHEIVVDESQSIEATCTQDGMKVGTCSICGQLIREVLPALGHDYTTVVTAPTCTKAGYTTYTCSRCGDVYTSDYVNPTGHIAAEPVIENNVDPTCEESGSYDTVIYCSVCDIQLSRKTTIVNPIGHDYVLADTVDSTCTETGYYEYVCQNDASHNYRVTIPAKGHTWEVTERVYPTCTEGGRNVYTCVACGEVFIEYLSPLGHLVPDAYDEVANCVHGNQYTCQREFEDGTVCGELIDDGKLNYNLTFSDDVNVNTADASSVAIPAEEIPAGADIYTLGKEQYEALAAMEDIINYGTDENGQLLTGHRYQITEVKERCEFDRYYIFTCGTSGCPAPDAQTAENEVFVVVIPNTSTGHKWALRDDNTNTDPSCTTDGTRHYYCLYDHEHVYTEKLPATGHNHVLVKTVDATCTEGGYNLYVCQNTTNDNDLDSEEGVVCGDSYKEYITAPIAHNYVVTDKVAATCTEEGYEVYTCSMCGEATYTKTTTPATGHNYVVADTVAATCTAEGYDVYKCTNCGDTYSVTTTPVAPHEYTVVSTAATCTTEGYDTYTCKNCGVEYTVTTTPATGHDYYVTSSTAATCTTEGYDTYTCRNCDAAYNKTTTHATGHTFVAKSFTDASCTTAGYTTYECINAGCTESYNADFISAKGHSYVADITAPTCTQEGYTTFTCDVCGEARKDASGNIYKTDITKPVAHVLNTVSTVAPTCGEDGKKISECENCDYVQEEVIPATGNHKYSDVVIEAADCKNDGTMNHICDVCGYSYTTVIPATGDHTYVSEVTVQPTCAATGVLTYTCSVCGASYTEELPKTDDHAYVSEVTVQPTCDKVGVLTYTCSLCGASYTEELPKTDDHKYESVITKQPTCISVGEATLTCSECGAVAVEELPKTADHAYDAVYTAPTCVTAGYYTYTCRDCGKSYVVQTNEKATGHTYKTTVTKATTSKNGAITKKCTKCGAETKTAIAKIKSVTLSQTTFYYSGKAIKPIVKVTDSNGKKIANTSYTVTYSSNKAIGTAKVTIKFKGNYSGTVTKTFKIIPKNVSISVISTSKKQIKFTWGKVSNCSGYQIQYSTSSSFKSAKTVNITSNKTVSKVFKNLKSGKKYYFRIRAYKVVDGKKVYGNWSKASKTCK